MKREICPDCENHYLLSIYNTRRKPTKQQWIVIGKYCPSCHYTKYNDSGRNVVFSTVKKDNKTEDFVLPKKLTYNEVYSMLDDFKGNKKKQKEEREKLSVLRRVFGKDTEIMNLLNNGSSSDDIKKVLESREERKSHLRYNVPLDSQITDEDISRANREMREKLLV